MKRVSLLTTAVVASAGLMMASCGGGSSSSSVPAPTMQKTAYLTVSYPSTSGEISKQLLSDDTGAIRVDIYQLSFDSNGFSKCNYSNGYYYSCYFNKESATVTPTNPTAKIGAYPAFSIICISQLANAQSTQPLSTVCSYAELKTGDNNITYTLLRGTWSLPEGKTINGYNKFAINPFLSSIYYYEDNSFQALASSDGTTWNSNNYVEGVYVLQEALTNGGKMLGLSSRKQDGSYDGFVALNTSNPINFTKLRYHYYYDSNQNSYYNGYIKVQYSATVKILDKTGKDITDTVLNDCKFSTTDGKSISGCLFSGIKEGTETDYTYKIEITDKWNAGLANCADYGNLTYDPQNDVCYNKSYFTDSTGVIGCYNGSLTYNPNTKRCEISSKAMCENDGGTYDSQTKTCTITGTSYVKGSYEKTTLTGNPSLPAGGNISVQKK